MPRPLMIANTRVYRPDESREVTVGTLFHARDEREAEALVRRGKAAYSQAEHIQVPPPLVASPVFEEPPAAAEPEPPAAEPEPEMPEAGAEPPEAGIGAPDSPAPATRGRRRRIVTPED